MPTPHRCRARPSSAAHPQKLLLVDDFHAKFSGLVKFRTGLFPGEDEVGLFAYTAADFAAEGFNLRRRHVTGHRRQGAGEDEVFAGKWSDRSGRAVEFGFEVDAG